MSDPVTYTLSQPVTVIDRQVTELTVVPPTGRHLMKAGSYMRMVTEGDTSGIEIVPAGMGKLIGACCNITGTAVESLAARDFMQLSTIILGFFGDTAAS